VQTVAFGAKCNDTRAFTLYEPVDYTRATNAMQDWAVHWTNQNLVASMTR
jgi:hypothetical protein